jgi:hypothetical protein
LYLEVDEDITSAIDKLKKQTASSVQIVVPKRSALLQSIINLKLLKKAAADSGKELVLVTNDRLATDLAGRLGLAVAPTLGADAVVAHVDTPKADLTEDIIEENDPEPSADELAAAAATTAASPATESDAKKALPFKRPLFTRKAVDEKPAKPKTPAPVAAAAAGDAGADGKPPTVPNFGKLQKRLLWAGLGVLLVGGYLVGMYFWTSAKVTLYANASKVSIDTTFTVDPDATQVDVTNGVVPGESVTFTKDLSASVTATGKKDVGTKAHGTVTFKNCEDSNVYPLSKGNIITSQGLNFVTDDAVQIPAGTFSNGGKNCTSATVSVGVTASQNGDNYNLTSASFTHAKLTSNFQITGTMTGGTTKTVTVVTQADVDKAKTDALAKDKDTGQRSLAGKIDKDQVALTDSQQQTADNVTSSPAVGEEATSANLTLKASYSELAVKKTDYEEVIKAKEQKQIGATNQIYDDGISSAQVTLTGKDSSGRSAFHFETDAYNGAKLDKTEIATSMKGKRYGDASDIASRQPGVQRAEIGMWPAWATTLPSQANKITVDIQVAK